MAFSTGRLSSKMSEHIRQVPVLIQFFCSPDKFWGYQAGQFGRPRLKMPVNSVCKGGLRWPSSHVRPGSRFRLATGSQAHSLGSGLGATLPATHDAPPPLFASTGGTVFTPNVP